MNSLYCFYDMQVSPCSYDFFTFIYSAEICRIRRGLKGIKLILVKGPNHNFRQDQIRTRDQNETFFQNVIVPGISLIPSCESFMWLSREEASLNIQKENIFPKGYSTHRPTNEYCGEELAASKIRQDDISFFEAPRYATAIADQFIDQKVGNKAFITLTTREIQRDDVNLTRQIDLDFWNSTIEKLNSLGFKTVLIRDTAKAFSDKILDGAIEAPIASVHLPTRMALYDKAQLNLTKNNGPAILQLFGKTNCMLFSEFDEDVVALSSRWFADKFGMSEGSQFPMTTKNKTFYWEAGDSKKTLDQIEASLLTKTQIAPNHTFHDEVNYLNTVTVGLRHLIKSLNFSPLHEDFSLYRALENYNRKQKFTDNLLELIASQRGNGLDGDAFEEFVSQLPLISPAI